MISTSSRSSHLRSVRQGFSLIEVAIALVIFVIGALAIIRIFPGALSVIGNNGDQQIATNLNRSVAARLASENAVPDTIFNLKVNATTNAIQWDPTSANHSTDYADVDAAVIGVPRFNHSLPTPEEITTEANNSALSRFRAVQGEKSQSFDIGTDKYAFTQFPISIQSVAGVQTPIAPTVNQDFVVQNVRINRNGDLDFSSAIKEDGTLLATTPMVVKAGSMIYASYSYWDDVMPAANRKVWSISEDPVPVSTTVDIPNLATSTTLKVSPPTVSTRGKFKAYDAADTQPEKTGVVSQSIDVRVRNFLGQGTFDGTTDFDRVADARRGMVKLPVGTQGQVELDYVADWSLLLQDGVPGLASSTTAGASQLALGAPFIEDQSPVGIYSVLFDPAVAGTIMPYRSAFGTDPVASNPLIANKLVVPTEDELRAGKVTFIVNGNNPTRARVAYRTRDSWVQQLAVAAKSYKPFSSGSNTEKWRDYYLGDDNYIYFRAGESGKMVNISYSYNDVTDDVPGSPAPLPDKVIVDRPFFIEGQIITAPGFVASSGFVAAGSQVVRSQLLTAKGEAFPAIKNTANINLTSIQSIEGTSVTVRTAYINGTKYAQTLLTSNRGAK